jgi:hypothetical protein
MFYLDMLYQYNPTSNQQQLAIYLSLLTSYISILIGSQPNK